MNKLILQGRLTKAPELTSTSSGISRCSFTLAVDRRFKNADGQRETDFINCRAWRGTAEFICRYFGKGDGMLCTGSMQVDNWTDQNGERRYLTYALIDQVEFPLYRPSQDSKENTNDSNAQDESEWLAQEKNWVPQNEFADEDDTELPFDL